jgi:hypothetical protein
VRGTLVGMNPLGARKPSDPDGPARVASKRPKGRAPVTATDPREKKSLMAATSLKDASGQSPGRPEQARSRSSRKKRRGRRQPWGWQPGCGEAHRPQASQRDRKLTRGAPDEGQEVPDPGAGRRRAAEGGSNPRRAAAASWQWQRAGCRRRGPAPSAARPRAERRTPTQSPTQFGRL